ncbi:MULTISPECIES: bifunctional diguanylate cyclase/phosphodiesterase [unclassified Herbaspirillum]|uniref:putative bifunctional diguanylate cyclase/phosphodiesterase n=1 Tax=unclassified Herbaspirillum TaxID=2624150 RepID=UPI00115061B6|nr:MULTISPECIES: EAL domain-containing protein [unclassified Herbaspirillum]TQK13365.1 diguanylate cyclase/phosphodiesterase [Herbaspirillum sp. SJZ130]TQK15369.1 diguanylate cyclase/phosphodiesterase [Herbaspirillum sp. SJZ106]TWC71264.1 diguanylate cyclase/phosphodiesterase [Herbaspirillum sp. SJZ099]
MLSASYDSLLVAVSLFVAILASYTALDMAERINTTNNQHAMAARMWLAGGAVAMGIGIWSMHFIGMLAFRLPILLGYDLWITMLSLAIAIAVSGYALWIATRPQLPWRRLFSSALLMGIGIAGMHYTGMAAMRMSPGIEYDPLLFAASVAIAIAASAAALWIAFRLRRNNPHVKAARAAASVVMGIAIVGMHYTGMAAANFPEGSICMAAREGVSPGWLAILIIVVTLAVLTIALLTSVLDARLESRTAKLASSLAEANEELTQMVLHDHLTKLPNRTLLEDRLTQAINKASRSQGHFALMFMDLDGFKTINDSLGHHIGDRLLVEVAQRLNNAMRAHDTVARLGGDEFVILVELNQPDDAMPVAEKLVEVVNQPFTVEKHELRVSASIGIAIYPDDGDTRHDLVINADAAMYHTKRSGRNGYNFFEPSMNANAHNQLQWLQDLRVALERKQFRLVYQPKFRSPAGPVIGAEALLRWQHPVHGMVGPDDFIALAERSGLIIPIGAWVLDEACRQMREWRTLGYRDWKIAVNLSALQFNDPQLLDVVQAMLDKHRLPPHCLTLEVTESTAMHDTASSMQTLQKIADLGVDISIDDFGTGYSSLLYLKRLPANELKIDRGFVRDLSAGTEDAAIVSAIVALGRTLNLRIVAEGVETEVQQAFLASVGCDALQGYLMGRPVPPEQFLQAIEPQQTGMRQA